MSFTKLELRARTSVIFTKAFIIAVADTVHFINKFIWERKKSDRVKDSLALTIKECGSAILILHWFKNHLKLSTLCIQI